LAEEGVTVVEEKKVAMLEKPVEPVVPIMPAEPPAAPIPPAGSHREIAAGNRAWSGGCRAIGIAAFNVPAAVWRV